MSYAARVDILPGVLLRAQRGRWSKDFWFLEQQINKQTNKTSTSLSFSHFRQIVCSPSWRMVWHWSCPLCPVPLHQVKEWHHRRHMPCPCLDLLACLVFAIITSCFFFFQMGIGLCTGRLIIHLDLSHFLALTSKKQISWSIFKNGRIHCPYTASCKLYLRVWCLSFYTYICMHVLSFCGEWVYKDWFFVLDLPHLFNRRGSHLLEADSF